MTEPLVSICAWCHPELTGRNAPANATHGICPKHRRQMQGRAAMLNKQPRKIFNFFPLSMCIHLNPDFLWNK